MIIKIYEIPVYTTITVIRWFILVIIIKLQNKNIIISNNNNNDACVLNCKEKNA